MDNLSVLKIEIKYSNKFHESFVNDSSSQEDENEDLESSCSSSCQTSSSDEAEMEVDCHNKWKVISTENNETIQDEIYSNIPNIVEMYQNPIYYINLYFSDDFYKLILENSLLYYEQFSKKKIKETKIS